MPSFPGDNLDDRRTHGDLLVLVQSDHAMITHHAVRDIMRRTKGRLEGRWAQTCFQRFEEDKPVHAQAARRGGRPRPARASPTARRTSGSTARADLHRRRGARVGARRLVPRGPADPAEARALGPALAHGPGATRSGARRSPARRSRGRRRRRSRRSTRARRWTPTSGWRTRAAPATRRTGSCAGPSSTPTASTSTACSTPARSSLAFCRDLERQFATIKRRTHGQDLDEYMVAFGGGYFFCPPGMEGEDDYLARRLVERA